MSDDQTKLDTQRDTIDERNSEIAQLHSRMKLLDEADQKNVAEHQKLFDQNAQLAETMKSIDCKLEPISDTYRTVGTMAKWAMAFLVFMSVLGGAIWSWFKVFHLSN